MFIILCLFFLLLSAKINLELICTGAVISALVTAFACAFLGWSIKREARFYCTVPRLVLYGITLVWEIIKANFSVLKRIYSRKAIEPDVVKIRTPLEKDWQKALLANSITLTPGTITLFSEKDTLIVHCLDEAMKNGLEGSAFEKRLMKMEIKK